MTEILTPGKSYKLHHERFGDATVHVLRVDGTWVDCEVTQGVLRGMSRGAVWRKGDLKTLRIEQGTWTPL